MNLKQLFFKISISLLLLGCPAIAIFLVASHFLSVAEADMAQKQSHLIERELLETAQLASPESYYFNLFSRLSHELENFSNNPGTNSNLSISDSKLSGIAVHFFDKNGKALEATDQKQAHRSTFENTWKFLTKKDLSNNYKSENRLNKQLQIILGSSVHVGLLKLSENSLIPLKKKKQRGFFFWKRFSQTNSSGVIFVAMPVLQTHEILTSRRQSRDRSTTGLSFWKADQRQVAYSCNEHQGKDEFVRINLEKQLSGEFHHAFRQWKLLKTKTGIFLISAPDKAKNFLHIRGNLRFCLFLAMTFALFIPLSSGFTNFLNAIQINSKLSWLFFLAVTIPVALMLSTSSMAIADLKYNLETETRNIIKNELIAVENNFSSEKQKLQSICQQLKDMIVNNRPTVDCENFATRLVKEKQIVRFVLRSLDGRIVSQVSSGGYFSGLEKIHDTFSGYLLQKSLAARLKHEKTAILNPPDQLFERIFASSDFGFPELTKNPDVVHQFKFGDNELFWYWTPIEVPNHPIAFLSVYHSMDLARNSFLSKIADNHNSARIKLFIYNFQQNNWLNQPADNKEQFTSIARSSYLKDTPESGVINSAGKNLIYSAFPGSTLKPYVLVGISDDSFIRTISSQKWSNLGYSVLVILILVFFVAASLSKRILKPIKTLDTALNKIKDQGQFEKVNVENSDELGVISSAFNQMIDGLEEMRLAKQVQTALMPQKKLSIPGCELAVFNLMANDLGGDYCDVIKLTEKKWLLLIGDVSGHGAPAAICMAMIKAAIFKARRDGLDFSTLPDTLSSLLLRTLGKKKMMTMLFLLLDIEEGHLRIMNAGHNWPIVLGENAQINEIKVMGLPLGIRKVNRPRKEVTVRINPGEFLFCYTDALIEAMSPDEEVFGHAKLYQLLSSAPRTSPESLIDYIKNSWLNHLSGGIRDDDLTLMVLKIDSCSFPETQATAEKLP